MDSSATESELSALISRHGRPVIVGLVLGFLMAIAAFFLLPTQHRASALIRLEGNDQQREATQQLATVQMRSHQFLGEISEDPAVFKRQLQVKSTRDNAYLEVSYQAADPELAADNANQVAVAWAATQGNAEPEEFDVDLENRIENQNAEVVRLAELQDPEHPVLKAAQAHLQKLKSQRAVKGSSLIAYRAEAVENPVFPKAIPLLFAGLAIGGFLGGVSSVLRRR